MTQIVALFVDRKGPYSKLLGRENCFAGEDDHWPDDARAYVGDEPVVCHPPCQLWTNLACVNYKRYGKQIPAWKPGGDDDGCFASALANVRRCGGVLEHPAGSHAWAHYGLLSPIGIDRGPGSWYKDAPSYEPWDCQEYWVCEVWQSAYGHKARKRTWLLYCGARPPFKLDWTRKPGTHQCGWFDRARPTLSKVEASRTPVRFAKELIRLAEWSKG